MVEIQYTSRNGQVIGRHGQDIASDLFAEAKAAVLDAYAKLEEAGRFLDCAGHTLRQTLDRLDRSAADLEAFESWANSNERPEFYATACGNCIDDEVEAQGLCGMFGQGHGYR